MKEDTPNAIIIMSHVVKKRFLMEKYFLTIQQLLDFVQLHQSLYRCQGVNVSVQNVLFDLQQQRVIQLYKAQLHGITYSLVCDFSISVSKDVARSITLRGIQAISATWIPKL